MITDEGLTVWIRGLILEIAELTATNELLATQVFDQSQVTDNEKGKTHLQSLNAIKARNAVAEVVMRTEYLLKSTTSKPEGHPQNDLVDLIWKIKQEFDL